MSGDIYKDDDDVKDGFGEIFNKLSAIDVGDHTEKRKSGKFTATYLSWTWAYQTIMDNYPQFGYSFDDEEIMDDGSVMTGVVCSIGRFTRSMWLPVMDHTFKAIPNPSARDISDARMRCLVKCISMFGLGLYIYAGEDVPPQAASNSPPAPVAKEDKEKYTVAATALLALIEEETELDNLRAFWGDNKKVLTEMEANAKDVFKNVLSQFKAKAEELQKGTE